MYCMMTFSQGKLTGEGGDDVGPFRWRGQYDKEQMSCRMIKFYPFHDVIYEGHVDENGIWGTWNLSGMTGGFHLWPKGGGIALEEEDQEAIAESLTAKPGQSKAKD